MLNERKQLEFQEDLWIYDRLIEPGNMWRKINEIDFSFVYDVVKDNYSTAHGRPAEGVERMVKLLLLKAHFGLSDRGLITRAKKGMLFKFFLGYAPMELDLMDPSLLSRFRRERLTDAEG